MSWQPSSKTASVIGLLAYLPHQVSSILLGSKSMEHIAHNLVLADQELPAGMLEKAATICAA